MISGKQGAGKTTASASLVQLAIIADLIPKQFKFADPLYEIHNAAIPILHKYGIRPETMTKDGELLQVLGTEYGRNKINHDVWAASLRRRIDAWNSLSDRHIALIDDCRFENEMEMFPDAFKVRLEASEEIRKQRVSYWREDNQHPSEIGLDDYVRKAKFDLVWSTENVRTEVSAKGIWEYFLKSIR